jgi:hypothetical protein
MAQKTNLNVNPYFDDFNEPVTGARDKNYYKVLFNPGKPIQARELNTLQSILQDQIESFGSHIFKEGSLVIPGNIAYDNQFYSVKLNPSQYGIDVNTYISNFVGKIVVGQVSGITARVVYAQSSNAEVEYPTIYVKYLDSDANNLISPFEDGEELYCNESVGTINAGVPFATTIISNSTATGSAASIGDGVYFIRGTFVRVAKQTIILDYYANMPTYRVGLSIIEEIITAKDDDKLYDNASGFTNYAAPGADRLKISLILTKKEIDDINDVDFVELLRIKDGSIQKMEVQSSYNLIRDYLAKRTFDESGNYVVNQFEFSLNNSLNDRIGNDGLYFDTEKTDSGNTPSNDLMCLKLSPGKAYVEGYDIEKTGIEVIDAEKPRTTQTITSASIPFQMGNILRVNNVSGFPLLKGTIFLQNRRKNSTIAGAGTTIGVARVYNFSVTDSAYSGAPTLWDLYLYDVQTYTEIILNQSVSSVELPTTSFIKGKSSGASGYAVSSGGSGTVSVSLRQTSGSFIVGEQILINGLDIYPRTISAIKVYNANDIKSIFQPSGVTGFSTSFLADSFLDKSARSEIITITPGGGGISTATVASPATFTGIKTDDIIRYQRPGITSEVYNRVSAISTSLTSLTLVAETSVSGICDGTLGIATLYSGPYSVGISKIRNDQQGFLYAILPNQNISSVNLDSSNVIFTAQSNTSFTPTVSGNTLTVDVGNFNIGVTSSVINFATFDEERYSIAYSDGSIENLTSDKISITSNPSRVTFSNISNKTVATINATFIKSSLQSKIKQFSRSRTLNVSFSRNPESGTGINTTTNDGLTYNQFYGLRVQDEEISLNYPDVSTLLAVYESLDTSAPSLDQLSFSAVVNVDANAIIGEQIIGSTSKAVARIVSKPSSNNLGILYLNSSRFVSGENVIFSESDISTTIASITVGKYSDITSKFTLDKGQKNQYYDYSKIVRKSGENAPSRPLLIIFDHYTVPSSDTGDIFTVNSYSQERFSSDIPTLGNNNIRATDTLDFRPEVGIFSGSSSSPFDFSSRSFGTDPKLIVSPDESALVGYQFYLGRIDKLYLDKQGKFTLLQGIPDVRPKAPNNPNNVMEIATITLPPYLYNPADAQISLNDNRRYTMRDIGKLEDRVENLEKTTSLSLLELNTSTLQIQDASGLSRFKSGFFVDDFKNYDLIDNNLSKIRIDDANGELTPQITNNSISLRPNPATNLPDSSIDLNSNYTLVDDNVKKVGDAIILKYDSVGWLNQLFATRVENVNPFHVISYSGTIKLNPSQDSWVRTIRLEDQTINQTNWVWLYATGTYAVVGESSTSTVEDVLRASGAETYMRSRNTGFSAVNMKPFTRLYQFLDGSSGVDFIPKLIEIASDTSLQNYGASGAFTVGETVKGYLDGVVKIEFRVAQSNHKEGTYNSPSVTYAANPYSTNENIPASYSASSKVLNVDIEALCTSAQGLYSGYLTSGMKLVGQSSGSVAYVKDLRLITDANGFISGSFFLRDPNTTPPPAVRIAVGSKVYKLTSSSTNETPLPGSTLISSGETIYKSEGRWEERQKVTTTVTTIYYVDPLAQSFSVGGNLDPTNGNVPGEDVNGAFLTAVDLYFASKDTGNAPLTVEIRTVTLGTPTSEVLGSKTLSSNNINISSDASAVTQVTFDTPIYLAPFKEYAIVLLAPQSDQYEVWIAEMGEKTINTASLPDSQAVRYTQQFAIGSLFKSQNGTIWTANQYQDLKFKLYKAKFTSQAGSALFSNPTLHQSNGYIPRLKSNPITVLPRKVKIGITTTDNTSVIGILTAGRKISVQSATYLSGTITGTGSSAVNVAITTSGNNYTTGTVQTFNYTGNGSGLRLNITATGGLITSASVSASFPGNGYQVGDVVGIVTSSVSPASGFGARITITGTANKIDTLYLSNVQGDSLNVGVATLGYYNTSGTLVSLGSTVILSSATYGTYNTGNYFQVNHYDHSMYAKNNKINLYKVQSDIAPTQLSLRLITSDSAISVASTENFNTFEGLSVSSVNPGFIIIEDEIIKYTAVGVGQLQGITRGVDSTVVVDHDRNTLVYKYELSGVSLKRINKTHTISDTGIEIDSYYIQFDRSSFDSDSTNRNLDQGSSGTPANSPQLSFNREQICGGNLVEASENIQFERLNPHIGLISPQAATSVSAEVRTTSGTSANGTETSFIDLQYEPVKLDVDNTLTSTRLVCSRINEQTYLSSEKSFTLKVNLATTDPNVSPMLLWKNADVEFIGSRLNQPISDYASDSRANQFVGDPHAAIYVSNVVRLEQPATSLRVIVSAYRHNTSDFRVLYSLIRPDSSEVQQSFELFPGYNNLTIDRSSDGFLDVIDPAKNNGLPDVLVAPSLQNQFLDYQFSASNLGVFSGYQIKIVLSGTNSAYPPRFKDFRSIALA